MEASTQVSKTVLITKRDGSQQQFEHAKLVAFLNKLTDGLKVQLINVDELASKVEKGLNHTMTTADLINLTSETAAYQAIIHPEYSTLAARVYITLIHKNTFEKITDYANFIFKFQDLAGRDCQLLADDVHKIMIEHADELQAAIDYSADMNYDFFGLKTLEKSYLLRVRNKVVERPQQMLMRVAIGIHKQDIQKAIETYRLLSQKWFTHATPTLFNAGTIFPQMSSCFLLSMSGDSIEGIYDTLKRCALISKSAGGIGLSVSCIRAKGSYIRGTNGFSNGLVPMLRVFDVTARYVDQGGGKRKGSFAMYLEPWHADIMEFLNLKKNHGKEEMRARDLFYGLWTPDLFMRRVKNDEEWTLMCPAECPGLQDTWGKEFDKLYTKYESEGKGKSKMKARELWNHILSVQIETGTPYILYKDACNGKSNQQNLGTIRCSNLCTEIVEYTSDDEVAVCNLASISLPKFVKSDKTYDFEKLIEITRVITRNLNKIIDANYYPIPEARNSNMRHRPIGIGVQGLADAFALLRLNYDSPEALELNNKIFETIYYAACLESNEIAKIDGHYQSFPGSPASKGLLQFDMWNVTPTMYDWASLKEGIKTHGMRNSLLLAPMPTASTSQILGNNETFEAFTSNIYSRRVLSGEFICINKYLIDDLIDLGMWDFSMRNKILASNGSIQNIPEIPEELRKLYRVVWEIPQRSVIDLAAGRGPFIDQSQSLNIHLAEPDINKLTSMHFYGWTKGLKTGMYYLRSRPAVDAIKFTVDVKTLIDVKNSKGVEAEDLKKREASVKETQDVKQEVEFVCRKRVKKANPDEEDDGECLQCGS
jgi:ribonucleoside-diphosphate reductase alpha subunit